MIKGKKIFVSGGAGFIGSHIIERLLEDNEVISFDNYRRNAIQYFSFEEHPNLKKVQGDILDTDSIRETMKGADIVFHLAAIAGVSSYYKTPVRTMEVNAIGTYNMLNAAVDNKVGLFINFSTSETYGPEAENVSETDLTRQGPPTERRWSYSVSKLAGEHFCFAFYNEKGLPVISFRPFNIYGPGQVGEGAIQIFCRKALDNETIQVTGDGTQVRAWCYIDDMVDAVMLALDEPEAVGNAFNIGNSDAVCTMTELAEEVIDVAGAKSKIEFIPHPGTDVIFRVPDITKAWELLGYRPKVSLREGIERSLQWYQDTLTDVKE